MTSCSHSNTIKSVTPSARGCEGCLKTGSTWSTCVSAARAVASAAATIHRIATPLRISTRRNPDWLDGAFSAGDLMMVSVLLRLKPSGILDEFPNLAACVARGEARPAHKRAFAAQLAINT